MGHATVTTAEQHFVTERMGRGGTGQAGATANLFEAWIDEWHLAGNEVATATLTAQGTDWGYDMMLTAQGRIVHQDEQGYSVKSADGTTTRYYSQPFFAIEGIMYLPAGNVEVSGTAWLDREWSSQPLAGTQSGWDWFSLSFVTGEKLMAFQVRDDEGAPYSVATWIEPEGTPTAYPSGAIEAEPLDTETVAGGEVPIRWRLALPEQELNVTVEALNPHSWMATSEPYWEGPVVVTGSHKGVGYLEMTGYSGG